ncbi:MAG: RsmB/NOP family class I SAM-dependent RNA methyltransferase [Burkholderiaceae bacterium]
MSLHPALIGHAQTLLEEVLRFEFPADAVTTRYFRSHPALGHRDRAIIAEATFAVLRHKLEFAQFAQSGGGPLTRRLLLLGLAYVAGMAEVTAKVGPAEARWLEHIATVDRMSLSFEARCNLPDWLLERLRQTHDDSAIERLANALNRPAPLDLRANVMKATRENALSNLRAAGLDAQATPLAPLGIRLAGKPALQKLAIFEDGGVEVQDEGSQILAHLVAPRRGELVVDFCAGAGGKTLALGALMRSSGRLYAIDVSAKRLAHLKPRLARSGLSNVHPMAIDSERDAKLKRLAHKADRVLVDAPCSGLGTLRRNPDLKWRQTPAGVTELAAKQTAILAAAARLVKPGGRLVYATCSLLAEENGDIVDAFAAAHPDFAPHDVRETLAAQQIPIDTGPRLCLSPEIHGTDGFFAAVFIRQ